jgi:lipopolysaccharide export system protein LptA
VRMRQKVPALVLSLGLATIASADDTARKTNEVLSSVAGIAKNLELADVPSPIDITADRLEFDYGKGLLKYEGNVRVDHAGAKIKAQKLEVSFEPEGKRSLRKITARGDVEVTRGDESAQGEVAEYDPAAATIVLSQNAKLGSGANSVAGEKVMVYLNDKRAVVLGGGGGAPAATAAGENGAAPASSSGGRVKMKFEPSTVDRKPDPAKPEPGKTEPKK